MKKFENVQDFCSGLDGWRRELVDAIRKAVCESAELDECVKWGNLVYTAIGPAAMIRAEENRVLFGFWRGRRLVGIEPRLKPGGKYEMATIEFREGDSIDPETVRHLVSTAVDLNRSLGDPTKIVREK